MQGDPGNSKPGAPTPDFVISSVPVSSIQGDLRRTVAVGPRHRKGITAQAMQIRSQNRLWVVVSEEWPRGGLSESSRKSAERFQLDFLRAVRLS